LRGEDGLVLGDGVADGAQLVEQLVDGELGEAVQLQFQDGVDLLEGEDERGGAGGVGGKEGGVYGVLFRIEGDAGEFGAAEVDLFAGEEGEEVLAASSLEELWRMILMTRSRWSRAIW